MGYNPEEGVWWVKIEKEAGYEDRFSIKATGEDLQKTGRSGFEARYMPRECFDFNPEEYCGNGKEVCVLIEKSKNGRKKYKIKLF